MTRFRLVRLARGLTQREVASLTGVSERTIWKLDTDQSHRARYPTLRKILLGFGMSWEERHEVFPQCRKATAATRSPHVTAAADESPRKAG